MSHIASIKEDLVQFRARLSSPDAALVNPFLDRLSAWCEDGSTIEDLVADLDRLLGQSRFSTNEDRAAVALVIARLCDAVASIGGMTMNERLFTFGLMERWDRTAAAHRGELYDKVLAKK
jgi:hypothetical protein